METHTTRGCIHRQLAAAHSPLPLPSEGAKAKAHCSAFCRSWDFSPRLLIALDNCF